MPDNRRVLWADDEIEMLEAHILFLNQRGYDVVGVTNGDDAIHRVSEEKQIAFDNAREKIWALEGYRLKEELAR